MKTKAKNDPNYMKKFAYKSIGTLALLATGSLLPTQSFAVPLADISAVGSTYTTIGGVTGADAGAILTAESAQSTGTGVLDPFLRLQNTPSQQGFNTDSRLPSSTTFAFDAKSDPHTHSLLTSTLQNNGGYYTFILDIGESGGNKTGILLQNFDLFSSSTGNKNVSDLPGGTDPNGLGTKLFGIDAVGGIQMADNFSGNGQSDYTIKIPVSAFASAGLYTTLYANFSDSDGSFEEFSALTGDSVPPGTPGVPDGGSTVLLLGAGISALGVLRRKMS